jgi:hypothetical protein
MSLTAFAAGSVTYDGDAGYFIFLPGSEYSPTDLFQNFKNVMPGDSLTEQIVIKNDTSYEVDVRVYMRSLGAQEGTDEFLSQMNLTVRHREDSVLFDAPANETAQLTDWVYLGTLYSGGEVNLILNLDIPIELGDEYQEAIGAIDWEFKAEELPIDPDDPKPPPTGDNFKLYLFAMLGSVVGVGLIFVLLKRKKAVTDD